MKRVTTKVRAAAVAVLAVATFAPALLAEDAPRSVSSATSAAITFDSRYKTVDLSETLPEFGTKPLGMVIVVR